MKERPIIFSGEMVKALLDGRKSQTRRVIKPQPDNDLKWGGWVIESSSKKTQGCASWHDELSLAKKSHYVRSKYGHPGDRLWVRETFQYVSPDENWRPADECKIIYAATDKHPGFCASDYAQAKGLDHMSPIWDSGEVYPWKSPIHMPRYASRITLEITNIRVERLQDISEEDTKAEGCFPKCMGCLDIRKERVCSLCGPETDFNYKKGFETLWNSIHKKDDFEWEKNPWVWVIEFKKVS